MNDDAPGKVFQCPVCHNHPSLIFRCTDCGEVRCSSEHCTGSDNSGYARWAADETQCRHCHSGYYRRLGFHSAEMQEFRNEYGLKLRMENTRPLEDFFADEDPNYLNEFFVNVA